MSIFENDDVENLLNNNLQDDGYQLPDADDNEQIFEDDEKAGGENTEAETAIPVKVQPKKRTVLNPRPRLNVEVLRGPRGLHTIEEYFKNMKYKGKGYEREDLDEVIRRLQHWGHRMYPNYKFDDVLINIERLGKKKALQVHMSRYRLGMLENTKNHGEIYDDDDEQVAEAVDEPFDEFDALLDEQIAISKVGSRTPGLNNSKHFGGANTSITNSSFATSFSKGNAIISTPYIRQNNLNVTCDLTPSVSSNQQTIHADKKLSAEQMARIAENRKLAQERLEAKRRLQQQIRK